jgi:adenosylcobinamide-GDP ribazoletransferase
LPQAGQDGNMTMDAKQPPPGDRPLSEIGVAIDEIKVAATFLTRLPAALIGIDTARVPDFRHGARVFPVVGALIGAAGGVVLIVAMWIGIPAFVAAALAVGTTVLITGGLHEDGLADMADSFGGATTEKKLEIMDDSRVGTYGALALVFSILVRVAALGAIAATGAFRAAFALIVAEAVSRAALVRLWHDLPAARAGGLSNDAGMPDQNAMLLALAIAAVIAVIVAVPAIGLWATILAAALAAIATYTMIRLTARTLGGRTGDTLGACQQAAVAAFLVGASAL